jgi:hypothetical protein
LPGAQSLFEVQLVSHVPVIGLQAKSPQVVEQQVHDAPGLAQPAQEVPIAVHPATLPVPSSTQKPVPHWSEPVQWAPICFVATHWAPLQ